MKYRLIKEYPDSPELGTEIIKSHISISRSFLGNYDTYMIKGEEWFKLPNPENYPEFWQPVVEKDYEILSMMLYQNMGKSCSQITNGVNQFMLDNLQNYKIYSIKRLSDGEIFTIGDKVIGYNNSTAKIKTIDLVGEVSLNVGTDKHEGFSLKNLKKAKQPLFTTEDGVDIFENNETFYVNNNYNINHNEPFSNRSSHKRLTEQGYGKYFSTKEKAEEYIIMNKPVLSINDILKNSESYEIVDHFRLKKLAKQKLNNKN